MVADAVVARGVAGRINGFKRQVLGVRRATGPLAEPLDPCAGPRHLAFHPDGRFAYVANELDSTISVYAYDAGSGKSTRRDIISTLPEGEEPGVRNFPAEVAVAAEGRTVCVSNRGP